MAQETAPPNEDAFHEIQLSGKQLVFLFMATTVVSVFIFLCGVLVGRGVRADREGADTAEPAVSAPVSDAAPANVAPPAATEAPPAADDELSYHQRLEAEANQREKLKQSPKESSPQPTRAAASADPAPAAPPSRRDSWVVQLIVLRNRGEASAIVQRLAAKGYQAFVVNPAPGAAVQAFKVQVGPYNDRREAEQAARRLEKEEQFKPWILR